MSPSHKLIRSASIGDTILISSKNDDNSWMVDVDELEVLNVILYGETTIKYKFKGKDDSTLSMSIHDYDLERIHRSHQQVILLVNAIPKDIMFQCKLSGDYAEAVVFQGYEP